MSHAIVCYDPEQYDSYEAAVKDGATDQTRSTVDATTTLTGIYDTIELADAICRKLGHLIVIGVIYGDEFFALTDVVVEVEATGDDVSTALESLYTARTTYTVTFTHAEIVELTHRVNLNNPAFERAYGNRYKTIGHPAKSDLYHKLNDISNVFYSE